MRAALILLLLLPGVALAQELDCLLDLKGKTISWDSDFQKDLSDADVLYHVDNVADTRADGNVRELVVYLSAAGPAKVKQRVARVRLEHAAYMLCSRVYRPNSQAGAAPQPLPFNNTVARRAPGPATLRRLEEEAQGPVVEDLSKLSYRTLKETMWLPARHKAGESAGLCPTDNYLFSCSDAEAQQWKQRTSGKDPSRLAYRSTKHPFISRTTTGWVRSDPVLDKDTELTECVVAGRTFSCTESDKNEHASELTRLEQLLLNTAK